MLQRMLVIVAVAVAVAVGDVDTCFCRVFVLPCSLPLFDAISSSFCAR